MQFITSIFLMQYEKRSNAYGDLIKDPTSISERKVYSNKLSVSQKEFYEAKAKGMKPEIKFEIREFEYGEEESLKYNNTEYSIIRSYLNKKRGTYELTCSRTIMKVI